MWAYQMSAAGQLERIEVPRPGPEDLADGDVLLRVLAGAICGSDLAPYKGNASPFYDAGLAGVVSLAGFPLHEVVGEVVDTRSPDFPIGARAVGWASRWNGLAEYVVSAAESLRTVDQPPEVVDDVAATVAQPLACVLCALSGVDGIEGASAAVIGQGPIGMLFTHALKDRGAKKVVGIDVVDRSDLGARFGVDEVVRSSSGTWARSLSDDDRPRIVIEAVGHQTTTVNDAIEAVAFGGQVFCFGSPDDSWYPLHFERLFRKNATLRAGITVDRSHWLAQAQDYLVRHPKLTDDYVTHVFAVTEAQRGFDAAIRPAPGQLKIALRF